MTILNELDSTCGLFDEELTVRFRESIRIDNEVRKIKGLPVAGYDDETQKAYLEYPDGRREHCDISHIYDNTQEPFRSSTRFMRPARSKRRLITKTGPVKSTACVRQKMRCPCA